jgi:molybdopterin/thiamine biosynthesis adenylyltransferase
LARETPTANRKPDKARQPPEDAPPDERLDRQLRIPGWNQEAIARARVGVAGDDPWLTGLFVASAAALGINRLSVAAPELDPRLLSAARGLNPSLDLAFFPGYFSHFLLEDMFRECAVLVDLCHHGLAAKLMLDLAHRECRPLVMGSEVQEEGGAGFKVFAYQKGREWRDLLEVMPRRQLPSLYRGDPALGLALAGLVLEETKKLLLGEAVTPEVISYFRAGLDKGGPPHPGPLPPAGGKGEKQGPHPSFFTGNSKEDVLYASSFPLNGVKPESQPTPFEVFSTENRKQKTEKPLAIVGAGALGNFVALGLAALGFDPLTCIDPDPVEVTNLNRQILFWDAVGEPKAQALAKRIEEWFGAAVRAETAYVTRETDLSGFAAVFDCTDNFDSRIVLSEKCRECGVILVSGGTGVEAGQAVIYDPAQGGPTPADLLGLYDIVGERQVEVKERQRASCLYAPEPAVIMTNQIIGGLMVDLFRRVRAGEHPPNLFYDARGEKMV